MRFDILRKKIKPKSVFYVRTRELPGVALVNISYG